MKGGGLEFLKNDFFENHLESFPDCENVFCTFALIVWALYYVYIVVEVTLNMAK